MNISTTKKELQSAFSKLTKTAQVKSQNPLVNYTYISSGPHGVTLHSTDLEVGVKTQITASVNTEGEGLFPTSEVNDIISVIDEGRVDIDIAGPHINIKSEKGISFDIPTEPFQEYPDMPENKHEALFTIETSKLKDIDILSSSILFIETSCCKQEGNRYIFPSTGNLGITPEPTYLSQTREFPYKAGLGS